MACQHYYIIIVYNIIIKKSVIWVHSWGYIFVVKKKKFTVDHCRFTKSLIEVSILFLWVIFWLVNVMLTEDDIVFLFKLKILSSFVKESCLKHNERKARWCWGTVMNERIQGWEQHLCAVSHHCLFVPTSLNALPPYGSLLNC